MPADTTAHRTDKFCIAPSTEPGFSIWRDVWRIDRAERQLERASTRKRPAAGGRVAGDAVGGLRQIFAAREQRFARWLAWARRDGIQASGPEKERGRAGQTSCQQDHGDEIAFHQLVLAASMAVSIGRRRSLTPVAAKMAFARAGAAETVPTSPSPPGEASLVIRCTSKGGISLIRI